jgi:NADPH2:quinone reductase
MQTQRFGESDRRYPAETKEVWNGVMEMVDAGLIKPTVYDKEYIGLESVPAAMNDLANRNVWGKAVVSLPDPMKAKM